VSVEFVGGLVLYAIGSIEAMCLALRGAKSARKETTDRRV